jgi:hypothetical protein
MLRAERRMFLCSSLLVLFSHKALYHVQVSLLRTSAQVEYGGKVRNRRRLCYVNSDYVGCLARVSGRIVVTDIFEVQLGCHF